MPAIAPQPETVPAPTRSVRWGQRLRHSFKPKADPTTHPEWLYRPHLAWLALAAAIGLAFTPWVEGILVLQGGLGLLTYDDRRSRRLPWFWWPTGVASLGPICWIVYSYRRPEHLRERDRPPAAQVGWQYVQAAPQWAPPAWYADPWRQARLRYWDGARWTPYVSW